MRLFLLSLLFAMQAVFASAQKTPSAGADKVLTDIAYSTKSDSYSRERLKLDIYYPTDKHDCPVVVWFHGGGLTGGSKQLPEELKHLGIVVVGVNYRLLPKVTVDKCLDDCAEAVAWVKQHIGAYNGSPSKLVVSGHSAGGYITLMLCLNKKLLAAHGVDADSVALYAPFSPQVISHFSYRKMQGIDALMPTIDEWAPLHWCRRGCPTIVDVTGDRELELYGRYEENAYFVRMMKLHGQSDIKLYEIGGYDHGSMARPAFHILLETMKAKGLVH